MIQYVMKTDDDCYVHLGGLKMALDSVERLLAGKKDFVMGHVFGLDGKPVKPFRCNIYNQ
jgi:hypothetical protein